MCAPSVTPFVNTCAERAAAPSSWTCMQQLTCRRAALRGSDGGAPAGRARRAAHGASRQAARPPAYRTSILTLPTAQAPRAAQVAAAHHLREVTRKEVAGRAKLGVAAFAEALLGVPKTLAENSGYDAQARQPGAARRGCCCYAACVRSVPAGVHVRSWEDSLVSVCMVGDITRHSTPSLRQYAAPGRWRRVGHDFDDGLALGPLRCKCAVVCCAMRSCAYPGHTAFAFPQVAVGGPEVTHVCMPLPAACRPAPRCDGRLGYLAAQSDEV
jgi:hypothetical protein